MRDVPFLVSLVGPSGSGKTTVIVKIIEELGAGGFRVGAVKRSHHHVEVDKEGKDSFRFRMAGANPTILLSDDFFAYMEKTHEPTGLDDVAARFAGKADIVLVEGFKLEGDIPRFVFLGSAEKMANEGREYENVAGFITDSPDNKRGVEGDKPLFHRDDFKAIARMIVELMER
ncbi:hypothetical protein MNBD_NITROSPINAE02-1413 [hydrothermal vent metagenome]|uniref:Molybdopterin-guanine dinucleotide biosynthesis protein B (MobB) domain-containing protein n=1 Tax=hydrothermal vent metagenome TaxID=652676 RepID=A0A3B1CI77_9ZZZZ